MMPCASETEMTCSVELEVGQNTAGYYGLVWDEESHACRVICLAMWY